MTQTPSSSGTTYTTPVAGDKFPFTIYVTPECLVKMNEYGKAAQPTEIGGLARVEINREDKNIFVTDIYIFPQVANAVHFQFSADDLNAWTRMMVKAGRADELAEWKSIFHTHPVGMGPNMSSEDVSELKNYAAEGDAFSFILSASNTADSTRMMMHYCCNFYGERHVIRDIPVKQSLSADRVELSDQVTKYLHKKLGGFNSLNKEDVQRLDALVTEFLTAKVPTYFTEGRSRLRGEIEQHVEEVLIRETWDDKKQVQSPKGKGYTPTVGDYVGNGAETVGDRQSQAHAIENDAMHEMMKDAVARGEMSQSDADEYWAQLTKEEQQYVGYGTYSHTGLGHDFEDDLKTIFYLYALAFDRYDTNKPTTEVSNKRAKKAMRMWELRVKNLNVKLREETEEKLGLYDKVVVDYSMVKTNPNNQQNSELETIPHTIDCIIHDRTGFSFEVAGELFWSHELKLVQTFEDAMEEARERLHQERQKQHDEHGKEERAKLQQASSNLEQDIINGPGDSTSTELTLVTGGKN